MISEKKLKNKIQKLEKKTPYKLNSENSDIIEYLILRGIEKKFTVNVFSRLSSMQKNITCIYRYGYRNVLINHEECKKNGVFNFGLAKYKEGSALYISISYRPSIKNKKIENLFKEINRDIYKKLDSVIGNNDDFSHYFHIPESHIGFKLAINGYQAIELLELGINSLSTKQNNSPTQKDLMQLHNHFSQNTIANTYQNTIEMTKRLLNTQNRGNKDNLKEAFLKDYKSTVSKTWNNENHDLVKIKDHLNYTKKYCNDSSGAWFYINGFATRQAIKALDTNNMLDFSQDITTDQITRACQPK